jgi:hypothetical protein
VDTADLAKGAGRAGAIAELLFDRQRFAIPVERGIMVAAPLRDHAQLLVGAGHAGAIAEPLSDRQRFEIPVERRVIIAAEFRDVTHLIQQIGRYFRIGGHTCERLAHKLLHPVPGSPWFKLVNEIRAHTVKLLDIAQYEQVVTRLQQVSNVLLARLRQIFLPSKPIGGGGLMRGFRLLLTHVPRKRARRPAMHDEFLLLLLGETRRRQ